MSGRQMSDSVFKALFRQAVIDNFYEELDSLPPAEELSALYTFSATHEARMKKLFVRDARKEKARVAFIWSKRAAAAVAIAVSILFGSLMLVPEVRATVVETIIEWYEKYVRFGSHAPEAEKTNLEPAYIPEGFWEEFREENETMTAILYMNDDGVIILFESGRSSGSLSVDNEGRKYELFRVDRIDYHVFTAVDSGKPNDIIWESDGQRYLVSSTISINEVWKMALSVEK